MTALEIDLRLDDKDWTAHLTEPAAVKSGAIRRMGVMDRGTVNGLPSVALLIVCEDGTEVIAQTTWALFSTAVRSLAVSPSNRAAFDPGEKAEITRLTALVEDLTSQVETLQSIRDL